MANLQTYKSLPFDKSYREIKEKLHKWYKKILSQLDQMSDDVLLDMTTTYDDIHYFASFTNALLIEQENQLIKAKTNEQMDIIQDRINQILLEIQFLQSISFGLNCNSIKLIGELRINYNNNEIKSNGSIVPPLSYPYNTPPTISNLSSTTYRFLISRTNAAELEKNLLPIFHLTSYVNECVLTFTVSDLDSFLNAFDSYWKIFETNNEIRMLIPQDKLLIIMGKSGEISLQLAKRFQLDEIKMFPDLCPKSDEKILLINGKKRDLIKGCIEEIYFNIEDKNKKNIKLYNPANLSLDEIMKTNMNYGGFTSIRTKSATINHPRTQLIEDEEYLSSDDDLWDENDEWWNCHHSRDNNPETTQREMIVSNMHAGVIIGVNASRIDRIKQKTGAYVYINGESTNLKRTVFMKGTREQVDRAYACIENLIERYTNDKLLIKQRRTNGKRKGK